MKRVNIALSEEAHQKAKIIAVLQDKTLNDYLQEIIYEQLKKDKKILERVKL